MDDEALRQNASIASGLNSSDFSLADFSYQNNVVQQTMLQHLTYTHFTGVTVSPLISTLNKFDFLLQLRFLGNEM